jgi:hypothetical protein
MQHLTLLDALAILFILLRIARAGSKSLGESLQALVALTLLAALLFGLRVTDQVRELLSGLAGFMQSVPGLGSRMLIVVAAWYLMRLVRKRLGDALQSVTPERWHRRLTLFSEGLRALLLAALLIWLVEPWLAPSGPGTARSVLAVRAADRWIATLSDRQGATQAPPPSAVKPLGPPLPASGSPRQP